MTKPKFLIPVRDLWVGNYVELIDGKLITVSLNRLVDWHDTFNRGSTPLVFAVPVSEGVDWLKWDKVTEIDATNTTYVKGKLIFSFNSKMGTMKLENCHCGTHPLIKHTHTLQRMIEVLT
jgi:hypothetical protein